MNYKDLVQIYKTIENKMPYRPEIGIVLGSGLGEYTASIRSDGVIPFNSISNFPIASVDNHKGQYVFTVINKTPIVIMNGRVHYYEGYTSEQVVLPIRIMKLMGINKLVLTNAAGSINGNNKVGQYMAITDHINVSVPSPLIGANIAELGPRFPDMTRIYDEKLTDILLSSAKKIGAKMSSGVYAQVSGPNFETPADIRFLSTIGADAVGMSTAIEAVAARHAGIRVCGFSVLTNMAAGVGKGHVSGDEVNENSAKIIKTTISLLDRFITEICGQ